MNQNTTEQSMAALALANQRRTEMVELRRAILAGLPVADALADGRAQPMRIGVLLAAQRRWGPVKAEELCKLVPVRSNKRVRDMTVRQLERVVRLVGLSPSERLRLVDRERFAARHRVAA